MNEPNWGVIKSGECFEALVHALVFADDPQARLMDRPGKDKGVDALSGDGLTVFQAKFGSNLTMDDAIDRSESELANIKVHRENGDETWSKVENWVLYANIKQNTWDVEKWQMFSERFKENTGLSAECHNIALINQQLIDHPEIEQEFFEGRNRCLLYAQETYRMLEQQSFLSCFYKTKFIGREVNVRCVTENLDNTDVRIVVVTGRSGIGRTRFLYELFVNRSLYGVRSYWGLVDSMGQSDSWFRSLNLGERAIIFVDDCNEKVLGLILNQLNASGLDRIQYVVSCADGILSKVKQKLRRVSCAITLELQRLSNDDMDAVVRSFEGVGDISLEKIGGICHLASGYPGWATFVMSAKTLHNHARLMDIAWDVIEKALEGLPARLQEASQNLLHWIALWGKVDFDGNDRSQIVDFLAVKGMPEADMDEVIRQLCAVGIVKRSKLRGCVCRVANKIIQHEILLRWLIDIDVYANGGPLRLTKAGETLIDMLISGELPLLPQVLDVLAGVSIAHLPETDARTFATPILKDIADKISSSNNISSLYEAYAFDVTWNIGICDPLNALYVLRVIKNTLSSDSEINNGIYGKWTLTHAQVCSRIPTLVKNIAENLDNEEVGEKYFGFVLELWDDKDALAIEFEEGYEPDKVIESLITSSAPDNIYHRVAFKFINANFAKIPESDHLQKILAMLFILRLHRAFVQIQYRFVMECAYATPGTEPWAHWTGLRQHVIAAIRKETNSIKRSVWWNMLANAHRNLLDLADCPDKTCKIEENADVYNNILKEDISIAHDYLNVNKDKIPFAERVVMRHIWESSLERAVFNIPDEMYKLATACEQLYALGTEYNIQEIYKPDSINNSEAVIRAVDKVARLFITPPRDDFYVRFFAAATEYLKAVNVDSDMDYGRTAEIAVEVYEKMSTKYKIGDGSSLDEYVQKILSDYDASDVLTRKFVASILRFYVKDEKKENGVDNGFAIAWNALMRFEKSAGKIRNLIMDIFCRANDKATGAFCRGELEKLLSLGMDVRVFCDIIPAYYGIDKDVVLGQLSKIIRGCFEGEDINVLSRIMIHRFYVATFQEIISPDKRLMDWLMDLFIEKSIPLSNVYSHQFESLLEVGKYKYPISALKNLFTSGLSFEHGFEISKYFEVGDDRTTYFELCDWVLDDGSDAFLRHYSLPAYLTALDATGCLINEFIETKCNEFKNVVKQLRRLALFAGCHRNDTSEWAAIASKVCEAAAGVSDVDRASIYNALNPQIFMWHGIRGEVSPDIIRRLDIAKEHLTNEPTDSSLRGYWEYEYLLAQGEYRRALADIEEEEDE